MMLIDYAKKKDLLAFIGSLKQLYLKKEKYFEIYPADINIIEQWKQDLVIFTI
jgi:hypothetical protein